MGHGFATSLLAKQQGPPEQQQGCIRQDPGRLLPGTQQRGQEEAVELVDLARRSQSESEHVTKACLLSEWACSGQVAEQAAKPHGCHQNILEMMLSQILKQFF